jgi:hypothetical protein
MVGPLRGREESEGSQINLFCSFHLFDFYRFALMPFPDVTNTIRWWLNLKMLVLKGHSAGDAQKGQGCEPGQSHLVVSDRVDAEITGSYDLRGVWRVIC